jgi:hypothetical protein
MMSSFGVIGLGDVGSYASSKVPGRGAGTSDRSGPWQAFGIRRSGADRIRAARCPTAAQQLAPKRKDRNGHHSGTVTTLVILGKLSALHELGKLGRTLF